MFTQPCNSLVQYVQRTFTRNPPHINLIIMILASSSIRKGHVRGDSLKGFTLIELLVVIAIIGILSSVVLASLNTARAKGADAAIKSDIDSARAQAELYYDGNGQSYGTGATSVCTAAGGIIQMVNGATSAGSAAVACNTNATGSTWALSAQLKTNPAQYWCADSTGTSTVKGNPAASGACPAS
jgi:prepilin-type N-terminal cleavage/methylation domain-containing protein